MLKSPLRTTWFIVLLLIGGNAYSQADFKADVTSGCFPLTVHFTDLTAGSTAWEWDFGNGNKSQLQHPSAVFAAPGNYNITLKATVGGTPSSRIKSNFIVVHGFPEVDFAFDKTTGCSPLTVKFTDKSSTTSGDIAGWFWVFGDGGSSQSANPTYVFQQPGNYIVTLKARNEFGCEKTKSLTTPITVLGPATEFSSDKNTICTLPATFKLTNQSTGDAPLTYLWTFGDGTTSTAKDPQHTYTQAGTYNVVLKTKDAAGCESTFTKQLGAGGEGGLDFTASSLTVCVGQQIELTAVAGDPIASPSWTFGDGGTASTHNTQHAYSSPGTYTVTLTGQLAGRTCPSIQTKKIIVAAPAVPSFKSSVDCDYTLTLTSTSLNASRLEWYIDDELVSTAVSFVSPKKAAGEQTIRLVAFNAADCGYTKEDAAIVPSSPIVTFLPNKAQDCIEPSLSGCAPFTVNFEGLISQADGGGLLWEFGDGTTSTSLNPTKTFTKTGLFQVTLRATNAKGCEGSYTAFVVVANTAPVANFTVDKTVVCAGEEVTFKDTSTNADFWCWDMGDQGVASGKEVKYKYKKPGIYTVTLVAKNAGCTSAKTMVNVIQVKNPYVDFLTVKDCADPFNVQLTNLSQSYDAIEWDFGDGQKSSVVNVGSHRYAGEGLYVLKLTGTNHTTGCTTEVFTMLSMQQVTADFDIDNSTPCKGAAITFTDKSNAASSWQWTVGPRESTDKNFTTSLKNAGSYAAILQVTDVDGCTAMKSKPIVVPEMEGDFKFSASSNCDQFTVQFENESTGSPAPTGWLWDFGDGGSSTDKHPSHVYETPGKYDVALTISNAQGNCKFGNSGAVNFTIPEPDFTIAKTNFCQGEQVIVANASKNAFRYEWDYGDGRRSDFESPVIVYDETGEYDIALFARDFYGCEIKVVKSSVVHIVRPTANFTVDATSGACPPFTARFDDTSQPDIVKWKWNFGDGKGSVLQDPINIYLKPGDFDVTLEVTDKNGCIDTKTLPQFVKVGGPSGSFVQGGASCKDQNVVFTATAEKVATYRWDFGDGVVTDLKTPATNHNYTETGTYIPSLTLIDANGCQTLATGSRALVVSDTTTVSLSVPQACIRINEPVLVSGKNETDDDVTWQWKVDGMLVSNSANFQVSIDEPGLHVIEGMARNQFNCVSHVYDSVRIQGPIEKIPNVITPNGDQKNQKFRMIGIENSTWEIVIVNRWGNVVYRANDYRGDWDGGDQPSGVYYFTVTNALCDERPYKGYVSVQR